ncbi:MAG: hypothetical protein HOO06_01980 [Bdellovibrionaceae bacterium]|jgi:hypothetical protein|nr:hypothetical protein [Pseudobdellovibrionaceae bacterium]
MFIRLANILGILLFLSFTLFSFQNCSQDVQFSDHENLLVSQNVDLVHPDNNTHVPGTPVDVLPPNPIQTVCNPLDPSQMCDMGSNAGLMGKLYYLMTNQANTFNGSLNNASMDDYKEFGTAVLADIIMTEINISPRSWESGFYVNEDDLVQNSDGEDLLEWFHLDLVGEVSLPAGDYQIATISDDGIRVTVNDSIFINNDSTHSPKWDCSSQIISFTEDESKTIRVEYFQGPRTQIALQLFVRSVEEGETSCSENSGNFEILPGSALSHTK